MHDFKQFPELTNAQMDLYYFESPHKQITTDFRAKCTKVHDGDTITLNWEDRDFEFPVRFLNINAFELNEDGGHQTRDWLKDKIEGQEVDIRIDPKNRVDKWGRLLGAVSHAGLDMGEWMLRDGRVTTFESRNEGKIPSIDKTLAVKQWF